MILIGRGLDQEPERSGKADETSKSWNDSRPVRRKEASSLCSFEGAEKEPKDTRTRSAAQAKPDERSSKEVGRPFDGRTDEARSAAARGSKPRLVSGDNSLRDPPVPIPNTEVKPQHADSTWLETAR